MTGSRPGRLESAVARAIRGDPRRIVITGSGGWLGMATLELLHSALGEQLSGRVACFGSRQRILRLTDGTEVEQRPLKQIADLPAQPSFVLHLAFLTKDRAEAMDEAPYREANRALSQSVLEALDRIGAEALFVASSGAAAFADDPEASDAMRLYGMLKREDEDQFAAWAETTRRQAVIARIFNLSGPHINKHQSYALASFILDAHAGRPIAIRATRPVIRGYVAIRELMSLVFAIMLEGKAGVTRFDTGGVPMEMQAIAEAVGGQVGNAAVERPEITSDKADRYVGDEATYAALLSRYGIEPVSFAQQVAETADFIANFHASSASRRVALGK